MDLTVYSLENILLSTYLELVFNIIQYIITFLYSNINIGIISKSSIGKAVIQAAPIPARSSSLMNHVLAPASLGNDAEPPFYKLNISLLLSLCPGRSL